MFQLAGDQGLLNRGHTIASAYTDKQVPLRQPVKGCGCLFGIAGDEAAHLFRTTGPAGGDDMVYLPVKIFFSHFR